MSIYFRLLGAVLVLLGAFLFGKGYAAYYSRRISQCRGYISLLTHIKSRISCFLTPPSELLSDFKCEALSDAGFLGEIDKGADFAEAFAAVRDGLAVGDEVKERLSVFFDGFGKEYRDGELSRIDFFLKELEGHLEREEAELPKKLKLAKTLIYAAALGLVILLI